MKLPWLAVVKGAWKLSLAYRFNILFYTLGTLLQIVLMTTLWTVLDSQGALADRGGYSRHITYTLVAFSLNVLYSMFAVNGFLAEKIRKGDLAVELLRPLDFQLHLLLRYLGSTLFRLAFVSLPFLLVGAWLLPLQAPADPPAAGAFLLSVLMGWLLQFLIWYFFGLLSLYSLDNGGVFLLFISLSSLFSGLFVPLWLYPPFLKDLAEILPFRGLYAIPLELYLSPFEAGKAGSALAFQAAWTFGLLGLSRWAWAGIQRRLIVQGG